MNPATTYISRTLVNIYIHNSDFQDLVKDSIIYALLDLGYDSDRRNKQIVISDN